MNARSVEPGTFADMIADALRPSFSDQIEPQITRYVRSHDTLRWLIFSDYVLNQPNRPNDVFAFTILPGGNYLAPLTAEFSTNAKRDFKGVKTVSDAMARLLADSRLFTVCFIVNPNRVLTRDVGIMRGMLDRSIAMMENWRDADQHNARIVQFKALSRKAAAKSFNIRLFDDIILATTFAAFLTSLICAQVRATRIGWFSDRDSITTAHNSIANEFFAINVSAFCQRLEEGWRGPHLGMNAPVPEGGVLWCDTFLRIPDYFAGTIAAWDYQKNTVQAPKHLQVLTSGIASKPNVHIVRIDFRCTNDQISAASARVVVSHKGEGSTE
jgi:hypothetical protein